MDELSLLRDVFIAHGYPERLVKETLEKSWEVETLKAVLVGIEQEVKPVQQKDYFDVLHAPYVKGFSESLQRKLKRFRIGYVQAKAKSGAQELETCCAIECATCGFTMWEKRDSILVTEGNSTKET